MTQLRERLSRAGTVVRKYFAPLTLMVGVVVCVLGLREMLTHQTAAIHLDLADIVLAAGAALASTVCAAFAWRAMLFGISGYRISAFEALAQLGLILVGKYAPGKISGLAARVVVNKPGVSAHAAIAASLLEQFGAMAAAALIGVCAYGYDEFPAGVAGIAIAAACIWWISPLPIQWGIRRWHLISRRDDLFSLDAGAVRTAFAWQVLQWLVLTILVSAVAGMVMEHADYHELLHVAGAYGIAVVAGQLTFLFPGGIGPREGVFVWLVSATVGTSGALAMALVLRIATTAIDLATGLAYVARRFTTRRERQ
jgi:hypothetical protein